MWRERQDNCVPFLTRDATTYWLNRYWFLVQCLKCRENRSTTPRREAERQRCSIYCIRYRGVEWTLLTTTILVISQEAVCAWWETFFCFWRDFVFFFKHRPVWLRLLYAVQLQIDKVSTYTPVEIPNNFFEFYGSRQLSCCKS